MAQFSPYLFQEGNAFFISRRCGGGGRSLCACSQAFCLSLTQRTQPHKNSRGSESRTNSPALGPPWMECLVGCTGRRVLRAARTTASLEAESTSVILETGKCLSVNIHVTLFSTHPGLTLKASETRVFTSHLPVDLQVLIRDLTTKGLACCQTQPLFLMEQVNRLAA